MTNKMVYENRWVEWKGAGLYVYSWALRMWIKAQAFSELGNCKSAYLKLNDVEKGWATK